MFGLSINKKGDKMICRKCKEEIDDDSVYCKFCGKKQIKQIGSAPQKRREYGSGSIRFLGSKRKKPYQVLISTDEGRISLGTYATKPEANARLIYLSKTKIGERISWTLKDFYDYWKAHDALLLSQTTIQAYEAAWSRLEPLENKKMYDLKGSDYEDVIVEAKKKRRYKKRTKEELEKMKPSERERYAQLEAQPEEPLGFDGKKDIKELVTVLCKEAMKDDIIPQNYGELIRIVSDEKKGIKRAKKKNLTQSDIDLIKEHDDDITAKIILIYTYSGMRLNELLKMPKSNVKWDRKVMIGGSKTEAGRNRTIPILPTIEKYIKFFYEEAPENEMLITKNGKAISGDYFRRHMFYPLLDKLGIERKEAEKNILTPHRTRHTFVQQAVENEMDPEALTKIAGYSKYQVAIDKYHDIVSDEYLQQEIHKIEKGK